MNKIFISNTNTFLFSCSHIFQEYLHRTVKWVPGLFIKGRAAGAWRWPLTFHWRRV